MEVTRRKRSCARACARRFNALDAGSQRGSTWRRSIKAPKSRPIIPPTEPPPSPEPAASTQPVVRRGVDTERNLADRDAKERFTRRLPALTVKEMPLVDFLTLMSQLGGVPVSIGSEHLQMAGISPREPVSLDMRDKSLDELLAQVLDPLRLEHEFQGPQVVVVRQGADQVREIDYPVDDLKTKPEQLAAWIRAIGCANELEVRQAGDRWRLACASSSPNGCITRCSCFWSGCGW